MNEMALSSFHQLRVHFEKLCEEVEQEISIQSLLESKDGQELYFRTYNRVNELESTMLKMKKEIVEGKKNVEFLKENTSSLVHLQEKINEMIMFSSGENAVKDYQISVSANVDPIPMKENQEQNDASKKAILKSRKNVPQLHFINDKDFTKIPKHVKGHLTVEQINVGIGEVNEILKRKYEYLNKPRKQLSLEQGRKRAMYLEQEKDLKGTPFSTFFMDDDIQMFSTTLKSKRKTKDTVFLTLRHMGKMKEIHKGSKTRYIILSL